MHEFNPPRFDASRRLPISRAPSAAQSPQTQSPAQLQRAVLSHFDLDSAHRCGKISPLARNQPSCRFRVQSPDRSFACSALHPSRATRSTFIWQTYRPLSRSVGRGSDEDEEKATRRPPFSSLPDRTDFTVTSECSKSTPCKIESSKKLLIGDLKKPLHEFNPLCTNSTVT